jgi:hypothetical protein
MAASILAQMLASAVLAASAPADAAPACSGPPVYDPANKCKVVESGLVYLRCTLQADHHLTDCSVASEDPPGIGLGDAALKMAPGMMINLDPQPATGARLKLPVRFKAEK